MALVSFWQFGLHCVTAMVTLLPYIVLKSIVQIQSLILFLFNDMLIALKDVNKCSQQPVCNKAIYINDKTVVHVT